MSRFWQIRKLIFGERKPKSHYTLHKEKGLIFPDGKPAKYVFYVEGHQYIEYFDFNIVSDSNVFLAVHPELPEEEWKELLKEVKKEEIDPNYPLIKLVAGEKRWFLISSGGFQYRFETGSAGLKIRAEFFTIKAVLHNGHHVLFDISEVIKGKCYLFSKTDCRNTTILK